MSVHGGAREISFNYFVELIKERARNPYKNYIEALPKPE